MSPRFVALGLCVLLTSICPLLQPVALAQPAAANPLVTLTGSLRWDRYSHTATLLSNGQVLVVGGAGFPCVEQKRFCYSTTNNTAELYDSARGTWRSTGSLSRRGWHSATLLPNGKVLVVGGVDDGWDIGRLRRHHDTAELYDPTTETWKTIAGPIAIRGPNSALLLPNGNVLVAANGIAELFDPTTETWKLTGAPLTGVPPSGLIGHLTLLPDGKVLTVRHGSAALYDPATETWSSTGNLNVIAYTRTLTLLKNGRVLVTGGLHDWRSAAEVYDPATGTWSVTGNLNHRREGGPYSATLLPDGKVLVAGGWDPWGFDGVLSSTELYDPITGAWTPMPSLSTPRTFHTATLLPNDKVLIVGGMDGDLDTWILSHSSAELFDLRLPRPTSLLISPDTVSQGQCFTMTVGNGWGMTLDVQYRLNGGPVQTLTGWPKLEQDGRAENICTSLQTTIGTFEFTAIRNTETAQWVPISTWVAVTPTP
jgi:WD40 repeat protein